MKLEESKKMLNEQSDFVEQKRVPWLKEIITKANHIQIYFPKFHPEFNFIERYWGFAKRYARANCDYSFKELEKMVPKALDSISLITIRRSYNHCWMYMKEYHKSNLAPCQVEWAIKKYSSHRRIKESENVISEFFSPEFMKNCPPA